MASINMSIRTDSELKEQAEEVLSKLGMNMNGTINMFLQQIVRDQAVPLSLSLREPSTPYRTVRRAQAARAEGYKGKTAEELLADIDSIIKEAQEKHE